jgi:dihydroorotase-like cyclic amidohydrolase
MSDFDLKIVNGTVASASETYTADIGIKDGLIAAIGRRLGSADDVIDAAGQYVLPGGIAINASSHSPRTRIQPHRRTRRFLRPTKHNQSFGPLIFS